MISKAKKLVKECIEKGKTDQINISDEFEWDTKTIASAIKYYLSKHLREPLFTFTMHQQFIDAASEYFACFMFLFISRDNFTILSSFSEIPSYKKRLCVVRDLYEQLPPNSKKLSAIIIRHLSQYVYSIVLYSHAPSWTRVTVDCRPIPFFKVKWLVLSVVSVTVGSVIRHKSN